ncbi:MAG TPA: aryl-sulfate sulfotransferase [Pirellulales bacterium]|nr:aryl-sulfate sulfotransferase [Pirellulales bacterium]
MPSEPAPQLVGEPITWTATVSNGPTAGLVYQFSDGPIDGPFHVVRDFSPNNTFTWAPMEEGNYKLKVTVKQGFDATDAESAVVHDEVDSRVTGSDAVITPTSNPLVALYSAPPLSEQVTDASPGETMHVEFSVAGPNPSWRSTNEQPIEEGKSTNFLVAGMLPNTTYELRDVLSDGTASAPLLFTTGSLPSNLVFPSFSVPQPPSPGSDVDQDMVFHQLGSAASNVPNPLATDLSGQVEWYYDPTQAGFTQSYPGQSLLPGGTVLVLGVDRYAASPNTLDVVREIDLAGNVERETNVDAVNAQLTALGDHPIFSFTHDVQRLPNGQTAVIGSTERTVDVNGTATEYVGMTIIVLDKNFQVAWVWDSFDHLDVNRGPILGEVLRAGNPDQVASSTPILPAVDWVHINAVSWSPEDGNLVVSVRHQDWVLKIDYENGAGDGHIIWRLGQGGDFTVNSTDPSPWFSHQHDAHYIDDSTIILFDNGNTRRASDPTADSRGQVWKLDEQTMTATLVVNVDVGSYSDHFGAGQRLSNGDYLFTSGAQGTAPKLISQSIEVQPDGTKVFVLQANRPEFRTFRMQTLYEGISDSPPAPADSTESDLAQFNFAPGDTTSLPENSLDLINALAGMAPIASQEPLTAPITLAQEAASTTDTLTDSVVRDLFFDQLSIAETAPTFASD